MVLVVVVLDVVVVVVVVDVDVVVDVVVARVVAAAVVAGDVSNTAVLGATVSGELVEETAVPGPDVALSSAVEQAATRANRTAAVVRVDVMGTVFQRTLSEWGIPGNPSPVGNVEIT